MNPTVATSSCINYVRRATSLRRRISLSLAIRRLAAWSVAICICIVVHGGPVVKVEIGTRSAFHLAARVARG